MKRMRVLVVLAMLWSVTAAPAPLPVAPPVFELFRTAAGAHIDPGSTNPIFALVIGSDAREGDPSKGRSDSLHLVAFNTEAMTATIVGIPRDCWVEIPGYGPAKINDSLEKGGPGLTVQTVEQVSGIPIHYWALIDFSRFRQLVDRLGGVDVDVPAKMADRYSGAFFDPGPRRMNGADALAFARDRHDVADGDIGRSLNQGRLLVAGLAKFRAEASDPFGLLRFLDAFVGLTSTNVPTSRLLQLGTLARHLDPGAVQNAVVPVRLGTVGQASVDFLDAPAKAMFAALRDDGRI